MPKGQPLAAAVVPPWAREVGNRVELRPVGTAALDVLDALPRFEGTPWAFPTARGDGHFIGVPALLERACAKARLAGITVHVLRQKADIPCSAVHHRPPRHRERPGMDSRTATVALA